MSKSSEVIDQVPMEVEVAYRTLDGVALSASMHNADSEPVLMVHGTGVDRHEDGFYDRIACAFYGPMA